MSQQALNKAKADDNRLLELAFDLGCLLVVDVAQSDCGWQRQNCAFKHGRAPAIKGVGNLTVKYCLIVQQDSWALGFCENLYGNSRKTLLHITHILMVKSDCINI